MGRLRPRRGGSKRPRRRRPRGGFREDHHLDPASSSAAPRPRPAARRGRADGLGVCFAFFFDRSFPHRRGVAAQHRQRFRALRDVRLAQNAQALAFCPETRVRLGLGQTERHDPRGRVVLRGPRLTRRGEVRGHRRALRSLGSLFSTEGRVRGGSRRAEKKKKRPPERFPTRRKPPAFARGEKRPELRKIEARGGRGRRAEPARGGGEATAGRTAGGGT